MLRIEMLPANHGDSILVEWGDDSPGAEVHRMLIDGGPYFAYPAIRRRLAELLGANRHLDLLVITHIDADHLEGALRLLLDDRLGVTVGDVWFNDYSKLVAVPSDALGPNHGEFLGALLEDRKLPWNRAFDGGAVVLEKEDEPRKLRPLAGLDITLLSPAPSHLEKLEKDWKNTLSAVDFPTGPMDRERALELLKQKAHYEPPGDGLGLKPDTSAANGSSIAFLVRHGSKQALLTGDAFPETLEPSLKKISPKVEVGALKLSHHGSFSSSSRTLLEQAPAERYLISTNGKSNARHPDKLTLDLLLKAAAGRKPRVVMNYRGVNVDAWEKAAEAGTIELEIAPGRPVVL